MLSIWSKGAAFIEKCPIRRPCENLIVLRLTVGNPGHNKMVLNHISNKHPWFQKPEIQSRMILFFTIFNVESDPIKKKLKIDFAFNIRMIRFAGASVPEALEMSAAS